MGYVNCILCGQGNTKPFLDQKIPVSMVHTALYPKLYLKRTFPVGLVIVLSVTTISV